MKILTNYEFDQMKKEMQQLKIENADLSQQLVAQALEKRSGVEVNDEVLSSIIAENDKLKIENKKLKFEKKKHSSQIENNERALQTITIQTE